MIEFLGWIGLVYTFMSMIYHRYMHAYHGQVYAYIRKKYGGDEIEFPSKEYHAKNASKFTYFTIFLASILIILNFFR